MRPSLDYHTLFFASGLFSAALLALLAIQTRKLYPGFVRIVVAIDALTAAIVAADLRGAVADGVWSIQLTFVCAFALIDSGLRVFCNARKRGRWPYIYIAAAILIQTYLFLTQPLYLRIIVNSLLLIPILADASLPLLGKAPKGRGFGYRFTAAVLMFGSIAAGVRVLGMSYIHEYPSLFFATHPTDTLFFSLIMFILLALSFGFIALTHERLVAEQRDAHDHLLLALESSRIEAFEWEIKEGARNWDPKPQRLYGFEPGIFPGIRQEWLERVIPEDVAQLDEAVRESLTTGFLSAHWRIRRKEDGEVRWMASHAKVHFDQQGRPERMSGIHIDITDRKQAEEALRKSEERFRLLFENAPLGIVFIDQRGNVTSANSKFEELSGYSPEEAVGLTPSDMAPPEERVAAKGLERGILSGRLTTTDREVPFLRKDGSKLWVRMTTTLIRDNLGKPRWGIAVFLNITKRKETEAALRLSEEKFRATFENAPLGIAECSLDGSFTKVNSKLVEILGYTRNELAHLTFIEVTHPSDVEQSLSRLRRLIAGEIDVYEMEERYIRRDRSFVWVNARKTLASIQGSPQYMILTVEDITARKMAEEDLKRSIESSYHEANHDLLTGLANRASFRDRLQEAIAYAKRDEHLVAIHLLDLDRFKTINDTLGHDIGDLLLKDAARRIKSRVRSTDLVARLGGDEFVVIQTHLVEPEGAGVLARKLVEDLGRTYTLRDQEVQSGASIGIALYPHDAEDPEALLKHADLALYDAKHRGRLNYQFYRKELGATYQKAQERERELMRALQENEFRLEYQPQFDLKSGRITGIEALLRWIHPERGQLTAAEFIRDAERARLMLPIGEWALQSACRQYREWIDRGFTAPLTINLSSLQLQDPRFLETLQRIVEETGVPASMLQLEMRESVLWDSKFPKSLLGQMKANGLRLALDDFGSEITALPTLDRFPLDVIKPAQKLVRALPAGKREATILAAIVGVAHDLKIGVCAAGVETESQLAAVREQGCDSVQGQLLSSPLNNSAMKQRIDFALAS
jgi:diguanylate cyclase (GGDEF)-like protein/PAS domain S-box-containing protein